MNELCGSCGFKAVKPIKKAGRTTMYRGVKCIIPATLVIRTCMNCVAEWMDGNEIAVLSPILENQRIAVQGK